MGMLVFLGLLFAQCATLRGLMHDGPDQAHEAYLAEDYAAALDAYEKYIASQQERDRQVKDLVYYRAGLSAHALGDAPAAIRYLDRARHSTLADADLYAALASAFREVDNLSREITTLSHYVAHFPDGPHWTALQDRLFVTLVESRNDEEALALWPEVAGRAEKDTGLLTHYFLLKREMGDAAGATETARILLDRDPRHVQALDWLARKHFRDADERYRRANEAYERNRTHRQYAQLLEEYEIMNTDLRIALNHFLRLYDLAPSATYARFLAQIYERFQDEENANYYRRRSSQ